MTFWQPPGAPRVAELLLVADNLGAASRSRYDMDIGAMIVWLMIAAGAIAAISLGLYWFSRTLQRRRRYSHAVLFADLCREHRLRRGARALLAQLADAHRVNQPARLFLEPAWLEPQCLPPALRGRAAEIGRLRDRIFGPAEELSAISGDETG